MVLAQHSEATLLPAIGYAEKWCKGTAFFLYSQNFMSFFVCRFLNEAYRFFYMLRVAC